MREVLLFVAFLALTVVMTWPWTLHLRDASYDRLDSYAHAYFLWWGYQQTLHDPVNLFNASILYPYRNSLAFGEHDYGISLVMIPFFMLGLRPLTVHGIALLVGFAFSGYGMFRLARTLTGSQIAAWTAGVVFAFIPYRFGQLDHLPLIFTGWMPLLLEALILFARQRSWTRAGWLGFAFVMNAITCVTWFVLTLLPLGLSAAFLVVNYRLWRDRDFWLRSGGTLLIAALALLPFMLPFYRVSQIFGFVRSRGELAPYSARLINWLTVSSGNKLWRGLSGRVTTTNELSLFPGFLPPFLASTIAFVTRSSHTNDTGQAYSSASLRIIIAILDALVLVSAFVALLAAGYNGFEWRPFGFILLSVGNPTRSLTILVTAVALRFLLTGPRAIRAFKYTGWFARLRSSPHFEIVGHALIWIILGFAGSFGSNFFFHRILYETVFLFQSMRMTARWAMICYVGLALLAGLGASLCAACIARQRRWVRFCAALIIVLAILFEQRAAPLDLIKGEVEPDPLSIYLAKTSMSGGIVDLPAGRGTAGNQRYMLRAADHKRPIVVATNSFVPPLDAEIQALTHSQPLPGRFLDLLESIPASYLVVHQVFLSPQSRANIEAFLGRSVGTGRLKFIHRFDYQQGDGLTGYNDLYAVAKTEPAAIGEASLPPPVSYQEYAPLWQYLPPGFQESSFFVYRLHLASTGHLPRLAGFEPAAQAALAQMGNKQTEDDKKAFVEAWTQTSEFKTEYAGKTNQQYVDELLTNARLLYHTIERNALVKDLEAGTATRATVLRKICDDEAFLLSEFDSAFVLLNYFAYFHRDPDEGGLAYWVEWLNETAGYSTIGKAFTGSYEYYLNSRSR